MSTPRPSRLYLVCTPIGNLSDLSVRAVEVLAASDFIYCENPLHSSVLFKHFGIRTPLRRLHQHNERQAALEIIAALASGAQISLVSDAGSPGISDPGALLVREVRKAGLEVRLVPGPSAVTAAAALFSLDSFVFLGFLPHQQSARHQALLACGTEHPILLFEAPHRLSSLLSDLSALYGEELDVGLASELTKVHESSRIAKVKEWLLEPRFLGEYVVCVFPRPAEASKEAALELAKALREGVSPSEASRLAALYHPEVDRKEIYRALTKGGGESSG